MVPPFVVAFVVGVTPGKWARVWEERMPGLLTLNALEQPAALAALADGTADVALLRLPVEDRWSAIPLYTELAVVVAPKDHPVTAFETLTLADLAAETVLEGQDADTVELVAANVGLAIMPQSVARALSRRDVVARPLSDGPTTQIALVWHPDRTTTEVEEFIGIVRGRTANSSRGAREEEPEATAPAAARTPPKKPQATGRKALKPGWRPGGRAGKRPDGKKRR